MSSRVEIEGEEEGTGPGETVRRLLPQGISRAGNQVVCDHSARLRRLGQIFLPNPKCFNSSTLHQLVGLKCEIVFSVFFFTLLCNDPQVYSRPLCRVNGRLGVASEEGKLRWNSSGPAHQLRHTQTTECQVHNSLRQGQPAALGTGLLILQQQRRQPQQQLQPQQPQQQQQRQPQQQQHEVTVISSQDALVLTQVQFTLTARATLVAS
ncbi:hypothetical protein FHG87_008961 [Trinorchestia longiramus]|nr:hypothetical protein FHG87_008961 [Trinorchestia longiramus]